MVTAMPHNIVASALVTFAHKSNGKFEMLEHETKHVAETYGHNNASQTATNPEHVCKSKQNTTNLSIIYKTSNIKQNTNTNKKNR